MHPNQNCESFQLYTLQQQQKKKSVAVRLYYYICMYYNKLIDISQRSLIIYWIDKFKIL